MPEVKVYSTITCPWCKAAKEYLRSRNIPFADIDVGIDRAAALEMVQLSGQYGVPVITINGEVVIGFDRPKIDRLLEKSA
ncbi:MAG TPA: NrdH-redoxin [Firmicutes bacterium]|nr:NrdH-redoxin [Bacillota bacterium]